MLSGETKLRVRYGETDKMGYCYYGNYAEFYEAARGDLLRNLGLTYREMEDMGIIMPVITMHIDYKIPAHYDDLLTVKVFVKEKPGVKIKFDYEVYNEEGKLLNSAYTTLCFVNQQTGRPGLPPQSFRELMGKYFD